MNTDFKRQLCTDYLSRMQEGKLEPAEQSTASTILNDYIRILENGWRAFNKLDIPDDTVKVSER